MICGIVMAPQTARSNMEVTQFLGLLGNACVYQGININFNNYDSCFQGKNNSQMGFYNSFSKE
jgi:hypothetical protein